MKTRKTNKFDVAKKMPPLRHRLPGRPFSVAGSEVVQWLISQPIIQQYVFDRAAESVLVYDEETGTWRGRDWHD